METINSNQVAKIIEKMTDVILENEVFFCDLDGAAGDGDFGMSLAKGFRQLREEWDQIPKDTIGEMLKECSMVIMEYCGGASGPIWGSAFRGASKKADGLTQLSLSQIAEVMDGAVKAIQKRGGAQKGDKTLLDALIPATELLFDSADEKVSIEAAFEKSAQAAVAGAEETKYMVAKKGRASYVGERSLAYPDAGAYALGVIFTEIAKMFSI